MSIQTKKPSIKKSAYQHFLRDYRTGRHGTKSLGLAFYDHFNLQSLDNQAQLNNIHAKDGHHALNCIKETFLFK